MASVDVASLSKQEKDELVCAYSALLLHDDGQEISVIHLAIEISDFEFRERNCLKSSKRQAMMSKHSGPHCSPRLLKDKTLKSC